MRKTLLHPVVCLAACTAGFYLLRRTFGMPGSSLWLGLFLLACGYVCNLVLIPWLWFSDWGRMMSKRTMGDPEVMRDPIYLMLMSFMPSHYILAIIAALISLAVTPASVAGACAVFLAASATLCAWRVMRWSPRPT